MKKKSAEEILQYMAAILIVYLEELKESKNADQPFLQGEKLAYMECLEWIQVWDEAEKNGLDFDIEKRYGGSD